MLCFIQEEASLFDHLSPEYQRVRTIKTKLFSDVRQKINHAQPLGKCFSELMLG